MENIKVINSLSLVDLNFPSKACPCMKEGAFIPAIDKTVGGKSTKLTNLPSLSPDLSLCKVYLSIFPSDNSVAQIVLLQKNSTKIKYDLSILLKKHLRKVPELAFFLDDSLDYIDSVEDSINNPDNPIK